MTGIQMCEVISEYWLETGRTITKVEPQRIWEYSPNGELFMVFMWYKEANLYNTAKAQLRLDIPWSNMNYEQQKQIFKLMDEIYRESKHECIEYPEVVAKFDDGNVTGSTYRCSKCGSMWFENDNHPHVKEWVKF